MKNLTHILSLDPSGSFYEGKGVTGWCLLDAQTCQPITCGSIEALDYVCMEAYWDAHLKLIEHYADLNPVIVIEDYLLYANKAQEQTNSRMETPKLIGTLQHYLWQHRIPYYMQTASEAKTRWPDKVLVHKGIIVPYGRGYKLGCGDGVRINRHCKDAIRHALHYAYFGKGKYRDYKKEEEDYAK